MAAAVEAAVAFFQGAAGGGFALLSPGVFFLIGRRSSANELSPLYSCDVHNDIPGMPYVRASVTQVSYRSIHSHSRGESIRSTVRLLRVDWLGPWLTCHEMPYSLYAYDICVLRPFFADICVRGTPRTDH